MSVYASEFQKVLNNYQDTFDIFYCKNGTSLNDVFNLKSLPKENPRLFIIDDAQHKFEGFIDNVHDSGEELSEFIEKFLDGDLE